MLKTNIRILAGAALLTAAGSLAALPAAAEMADPPQSFLAMGTSAPGGSMFPLGAAMASVVSAEYPQIDITIEATGGSPENIRLVGTGAVELGMTTSDLAYHALHGLEPYDEPITDFRGLIAGHENLWQLYALRSSGISSIEDLRGKTVSLGQPGSIGNSVGRDVLEAHGLIMNEDWTPEYLSHGNGPGALRDGRVDAVLQISNAGVAAVADITSTHGEDVVFLNPDPDILADLLEQYPYWTPGVIPGGVYPGHDEDIPGTFALKTILIAATSLPDETAYAITKALLENTEALARGHALARFWTADNAVAGIDGILDFHPGAEAYLREQGLLD